MSRNNEIIKNGSGIAFVLDNQDYPPGAFKELNSEKYPSSFSVNYDKSDLISPEDMGYIDQTETIEAVKRNLIDRSNSLNEDKRMNRFIFESVLETIKKYNGIYNVEVVFMNLNVHPTQGGAFPCMSMKVNCKSLLNDQFLDFFSSQEIYYGVHTITCSNFIFYSVAYLMRTRK